ncbi:DNA polymerase IV [Natranaerobius thermophilus]|uniref:DNA polymerase IV n=1 Tax=Natranaerobius thermophilus (strain ATCC BAA-1301 / DSM 18059 / JW/NM-WN-LF) TaxID=457570 RepID=B2A8L2_NATTJ|nr:DNA polymerase IV [Natranaerobius thermophilus]ACB85896.1 DNA-directed DNA polymerase [Natranaerobius thermophilus JW/NM-WN-LF]
MTTSKYDRNKNNYRQILHIDMDAFYASVEKRDNPELEDKPVIIGGSRRGVVSTCCYKARKYGLHSAMPMYRAQRLCPHGVYLRPDMDKYRRVSQEIKKIFLEFTPLVEPLSLDEAFLDVTGSLNLFGDAVNIAEKIQTQISDQLQLTCSIGVATNKFIAKVASDLKKPAGLTHVPTGKEQDFLAPLPVDKLWGVGEKTTARIKSRGYHTIGELQQMLAKAQNINSLAKSFNITEDTLLLAKGYDDREVVPEEPPKSIGQEKTFAQDLTAGSQYNQLIPHLLKFSEQVGARLRKAGYKGKTVTVKIRDSRFKTWTKQKTVPETDQDKEIYAHAQELLQNMNLKPSDEIRLLGVTVSNLVSSTQQQLSLDMSNEQYEKEQQLQWTLDEMREKFGDDAIRRARLIFPQEQK